MNFWKAFDTVTINKAQYLKVFLNSSMIFMCLLILFFLKHCDQVFFSNGTEKGTQASSELLQGLRYSDQHDGGKRPKGGSAVPLSLPFVIPLETASERAERGVLHSD